MTLSIAIVVESFPTLSETFITNKVIQLCSRGHKVTVITHRKKHDKNLVALYRLNTFKNLEILPPVIPVSAGGWLTTVVKKPGIFISAIGSKKGLKNTARENLLATAFGNKTFDVIHFEFSALAIVYRHLLKAMKPVTVVSCRGTAEKVKPLTVPGRQQQLTEVFNSVDAVHCVSADMAETIKPWCNQPEKIFINRPSIDIDYFVPAQPSLPSTVFTILSVGRFTFQKGYLTGLLAIKQLAAKQVNFHWNIVGDGPQMEEMLFHIHTLGLQNSVTLLGKKNKDEILNLYKQSDVFLLSSVYEGIANVVLEAMAMQLPVVATKSGDLQEVIEHNVDGLLAEVYDHQALANELLELYHNRERGIEMGIKAREKIISQFTIKRQTDQFETEYFRLVKAKGG